MLAKIIKKSGRKLLLEVDEDINPEYLETIRRGKEGFAEIKFIDNDPKSAKQNALSHSLLKDIAESENIPRYEAKEKCAKFIKISMIVSLVIRWPQNRNEPMD